MRRLLSLVIVVGVLFLPGLLWAQVATPKAPEADEVRISQASVPTAAEVLAKFTPGVEEVQVRGLDSQQADAAFLSTTNNRLVEIGNGLQPGQKVDFRTTDGQRFRVQNEDGQLRFRLRDVTVQDPQALANAFPPGSRVEIRGVDANGNRFRLAIRDGVIKFKGFDANGNRVRFEMRNGVVKKNEVEADHSGKGRMGTSSDINNEHAKDEGKDLDHSIRGRDRAEREHERIEVEREARRNRDRVERQDKVERMEKMEKIERAEKFERSGHH